MSRDLERPGPLPTYMAIANLEHEIAVMRERLQNIERVSRWIWPFFWSICAVSAALIALLAFRGEPAAVGVAAACFALVAVLAMGIRSGRLIDFTSLIRFGYPEVSHAVFLEKEIAARERRLAELRSRP